MKNDHATKKQRKQRQQTTEPVASEQQSRAEVASPEPATFNLQPATGSGGSAPTPHSALVAPKPGEGGPGIPDSKRHRNGKVARLPKNIRHRVNELLDDGLSYPQVVKELAQDGYEITARAVMSWKGGGYQDYLRQQRILDQCRLRHERAFDLLRQNGPINGFQATQQLASAQICEAVADFGTDILREALVANPLNYFRMLNSFTRLTNGGLRCERHLADEADRKAALKRKKSRPKKGISAKATREMEEKINLM